MFIPRLSLMSFLMFLILSCNNILSAQEQLSETTEKNEISVKKPIKVGAEKITEIQKLVFGKSVALMANQTSMVSNTHLVDTLLSINVNLVKIFSPEHGFRGEADAGELINSNIDAKTGLPIVSLYGANKKPTTKQLEDVDVIIFDLQDVGARFYTYISTMHYMMEAAAENGVSVIVLDRPNPTGGVVDGPIRKKGFVSFVSMDPIPVLHGMTVGELAQMMNGEGWLKNAKKCDLTIVPIDNYERDMFYSLPVSPSPNLRSDAAIQLYPSLCFFEGTVVSIGRGTQTPFEIFGHPNFKDNKEFAYQFKPVSSFGAKNPKLENTLCYGQNLHDYYEKGELATQLEIKWLLEAYQAYGSKPAFFDRANFFDLLAGTNELRKQIIAGKTEEEIRDSWKEELKEFRELRKKYLIYPDK